MRSASKYMRALPFAVALVLGGCDVSPLEVDTVSRNRIMRFDDERDDDVYQLRLTSPGDSAGIAGNGQTRR